MRTLTPGQWYLRFTCEQCQTKQVLFPDLSRGKAKIKATYVVECSSCSHKGSYDGDHIERYQHPSEPDT
jgi:DNA-directed RNA polymerase subunit M/transcription elongation factor TFIIS